MAMFAERVEPGYIRELHWHPNAAELSCCLAGEGTLFLASPDGDNQTVALRPGVATFVPLGYGHAIRNTGTESLHLVLGFTNENPETIDFSFALPAVPVHFIAQTFGVADSALPHFASAGDRVFVPLPASTPLSPATSSPSSGSFSVAFDQIEPEVYAGGTVRPVRVDQIPRLAGLTVFDLVAGPTALREPHWHANASELNYCVRGAAELTIVAPDGTNQRFVVEPGDVAYIPANWFHYIANITSDSLEFLVYFSNVKPDHVDLSQTVAAFPPELLAASFGVDPRAFADLPNHGDVFIAK
jgi:oxalate decarboxylase